MNIPVAIKHIRLASDLHQNSRVGKRFSPSDLWEPEESAWDKETALVLAGDLWEGVKFLKFSNYSWLEKVAKRFAAVILVLGNHDYYGGSLKRLPIKVRSLIAEQGLTNVYLLDDSEVHFENVSFIGGTLWTDTRSIPASWLEERWPDGGVVNDYVFIRNELNRKIKKLDALNHHFETISYLNRRALTLKLEYPNNPLVVVTHHAPSLLIKDQRLAPSTENYNELIKLKGSDISEWSAIVTAADLWLHGHVHSSQFYKIKNLPVFANPLGWNSEKTEFDRYWCLDVEDLKGS